MNDEISARVPLAVLEDKPFPAQSETENLVRLAFYKLDGSGTVFNYIDTTL
jgi:hypothetical protein